MVRTARDSEGFRLRLPDGLRDRIRVEAERNGRSMNAEIVATLERAFPELGMDRRTADAEAALAILARFIATDSDGAKS